MVELFESYRINLGYTAENSTDVTPVKRSVTVSAINRRSIPFNLSKPTGQYIRRQFEHQNYALCIHYVFMYSKRFLWQTVFNYFTTQNLSISTGSIVLCVVRYGMNWNFIHTHIQTTEIQRRIRQTDGREGGRTDRRTGRQTDGRTDGQIDRQTDGRMGRPI